MYVQIVSIVGGRLLSRSRSLCAGAGAIAVEDSCGCCRWWFAAAAANSGFAEEADVINCLAICDVRRSAAIDIGVWRPSIFDRLLSSLGFCRRCSCWSFCWSSSVVVGITAAAPGIGSGNCRCCIAANVLCGVIASRCAMGGQRCAVLCCLGVSSRVRDSKVVCGVGGHWCLLRFRGCMLAMSSLLRCLSRVIAASATVDE